MAKRKEKTVFSKKIIILLLVGTLVGSVFLLLFYRVPISLFLAERGFSIPLAKLLNQDDPRVTFAAGNYYFGGKAYDVERAKQTYQTTIALDEHFQGAHYQLSRIYFIEGRLVDALGEIDKELAYYPDYKRSYYIRGLVYGYAKLYSEAGADFEEFLRWKPESWAGHNDLAWIYFQMGAYDKALATSLEGLKYSPNNVWLLNSRGVALLNLGRKSEAKKAFEQALPLVNKMTESDWGRAYPGNNPTIYPNGLKSMQESIQKNLELLK